MYHGTGRAKDDENLVVEFFFEAVEDKQASAKEGHPVFKDVEHVRITVPGNRPTVVVKKVDDEVRRRFPGDYDRFKRGATERPSHGLPLREWPQILASQVKKLEYFEVRTVEQLAALPDGVAEQLGSDGYGLRKKAQTFLETAKAEAPLAQMKEENQALKDQLSQMQAEMVKLNARFEAEKERKGK